MTQRNYSEVPSTNTYDATTNKPNILVKPPQRFVSEPFPQKNNDQFVILKDKLMTMLTNTINNLEAKEKNVGEVDGEIMKVAKLVLDQKSKNGNEHIKRSRIELVGLVEKDIVVQIGTAREEHEQIATKRIISDLQKLYLKDLEDVLITIRHHRSKIQSYKYSLEELKFSKENYEANVGRLVQFASEAEQQASSYYKALSRANFFINPAAKRLFGEGRPRVKFVSVDK